MPRAADGFPIIDQFAVAHGCAPMNAPVADCSNLSAPTKYGDRSFAHFIRRASAIWQVFDIP